MVDEAAAIPLPLVKKLMGPYLLFLSSTINGYEGTGAPAYKSTNTDTFTSTKVQILTQSGTGRSLSLKLIEQLRETQNRGGVQHVSMRSEDAGAAGMRP